MKLIKCLTDVMDSKMEAPRKLHAKIVLGRLWRFFHYMRTHEVSSPLLLQIYYVKTFSSAYFLSKEELKRRSMYSAINVLITYILQRRQLYFK